MIKRYKNIARYPSQRHQTFDSLYSGKKDIEFKLEMFRKNPEPGKQKPVFFLVRVLFPVQSYFIARGSYIPTNKCLRLFS